MKTARQSGWSLSMREGSNFVFLSDERGHRLEVTYGYDGLSVYGDYLEDCPQSVIDLVYLWLGLPVIVISADGDPVCCN